MKYPTSKVIATGGLVVVIDTEGTEVTYEIKALGIKLVFDSSSAHVMARATEAHACEADAEKMARSLQAVTR